jgi:hypothetical protein
MCKSKPVCASLRVTANDFIVPLIIITLVAIIVLWTYRTSALCLLLADRTNVLGVFYIAQAAAKYWVKTKFTEGEFRDVTCVNRRNEDEMG